MESRPSDTGEGRWQEGLDSGNNKRHLCVGEGENTAKQLRRGGVGLRLIVRLVTGVRERTKLTAISWRGMRSRGLKELACHLTCPPLL